MYGNKGNGFVIAKSVILSGRRRMTFVLSSVYTVLTIQSNKAELITVRQNYSHYIYSCIIFYALSVYFLHVRALCDCLCSLINYIFLSSFVLWGLDVVQVL